MNITSDLAKEIQLEACRRFPATSGTDEAIRQICRERGMEEHEYQEVKRINRENHF